MRRLHPLSAVVDAIARGVRTAVAFFILGAILPTAVGIGDPALGGLLGPAGFLVGGGYAIAYYLRFTYEISGDTLTVASGVFARQEREIPLRRIQNVDISRPPFQRLLGLAVVRFETAGGSTTEAVLDAVGRTEADRLQQDVGERGRADRGADRLEGSAGTHHDREGTVDGEQERRSGRAAERTLFELSTKELVALCLVSFRPGAAVVAAFAFSAGDDAVFFLLREILGPEAGTTLGDLTALPVRRLVLAGAIALATFVVVSWLVSAALMFAGYYGFRLARVGDELRYERGLVGRYSGSVPLDKVQTLTIRENLIMRAIGYASLTVETAGYAPGSDDDGGGQGRTVPLARRERVLELAGRIEGFDDLSVQRPPRRARRRYAGRYAIALGALAGATFLLDRAILSVDWIVPPAILPLALLVVAPVAAHCKWRNLGYRLGDDVLVTRSGFWRRSNRIVPYYRIQTVFQRRTIFQRRWRLASVVADTAGSSGPLGAPPTAHDRDREEASALDERLRERLHEQLQERRRSRGSPRRRQPAGGPAPEDTRADAAAPREPGRAPPDGRGDRDPTADRSPGPSDGDRDDASPIRGDAVPTFGTTEPSPGDADSLSGDSEPLPDDAEPPSGAADRSSGTGAPSDDGREHPIGERTYLLVGGVSGAIGLFALPVVFGPLAILAGYRVYRLYDGRRGRVLVAWGIVCTAVGIALNGLASLFGR